MQIVHRARPKIVVLPEETYLIQGNAAAVGTTVLQKVLTIDVCIPLARVYYVYACAYLSYNCYVCELWNPLYRSDVSSFFFCL
jgi:hypothetical protein